MRMGLISAQFKIFNLEIKGLIYTKKINTEADMEALDEKIRENIPMR